MGRLGLWFQGRGSPCIGRCLRRSLRSAGEVGTRVYYCARSIFSGFLVGPRADRYLTLDLVLLNVQLAPIHRKVLASIFG